MKPKLFAEWFWVDRWTGSSAFLLPISAKGLYREMLSQAWLRGGKLPNDPASIQRAVGCTPEEWAANWPLIARYFRAKNGQLFNQTQAKIYRQAVRLSSTRSDAGRRGGLRSQSLKLQAKRQAKLQANGQANSEAKFNPLSLSLSFPP